MARGLQDPATQTDVAALEMTKWFDTNYHFLVPELEPDQAFTLDPSRILAEIGEARAGGHRAAAGAPWARELLAALEARG